MLQHDMPMRSVWSELWEADPFLYIALQLTTTIDNALLLLLLIAAFSVSYDTFCVWAGRRTRQTYNYQIINSAVETPTYGMWFHLARTKSRCLEAVYAKVVFHLALYLGVQYAITQVITQVARVFASALMTDGKLRRRCSRLLERGLECDVAIRYHDPLLMATTVVLLCIIRGLELHVELPNRPLQNSNYSPGFLCLRAKCRRIMQAILAAPTTMVYMYACIPRNEWWQYGRLLLAQTCASCFIFFVGNFVCFVAALPDFQGTMQKLDGSGITGKKGV